MGLDVYVGAFTRYYSGQWETVVQSNAREQGYEVQIVRSANEEDDVTDPQEIASGDIACYPFYRAQSIQSNGALHVILWSYRGRR